MSHNRLPEPPEEDDGDETAGTSAGALRGPPVKQVELGVNSRKRHDQPPLVVLGHQSDRDQSVRVTVHRLHVAAERTRQPA